MRQFMTALALVAACALAAGTTTGAQAKPAKAATKTAAKMATHSTTGTVKSMDGNTLVISKPGKKGGDMTFTVNGSTQKDGTVGVGSHVTVRYQNEGSTMVATAISGAANQTASSKPASSSKPATKK